LSTVNCGRIMSEGHGCPTTMLITGSFDGSVQTHELKDFKGSQSWIHNYPVLSIGVSPCNDSMAFGMAEGTFCLRKYTGLKTTRSNTNKLSTSKHKPEFNTNYRQLSTSFNDRKKTCLNSELVITQRSDIRVKLYTKWFKKSEPSHSKALEAALSERSPYLVLVVFKELLVHSRLHKALNVCNLAIYEPIVDFLDNYISNPQYTHTLIYVLEIFLVNLTNKVSHNYDLVRKLVRLKERILNEVWLREELMEVEGLLKPILTAYA